jgi:hypothetical protein
MFFSFKQVKKNNYSLIIQKLQYSIFTVFLISFIVFIIGLNFFVKDFDQLLCPICDDYSPISIKHYPTFIVYEIFFLFALLKIWLKNGRVAPLAKILYLIFIAIGVYLSFLIVIQVINKKELEESSYIFHFELFIYPFLSIIIGTSLFYKAIKSQIEFSKDLHYKNRFLNKINLLIQKSPKHFYCFFILFFPVVVIITCIVILFGQDVNSFHKIFTETTTWNLSTKLHPPLIDHQGHNLCTVAAKGSPKIVKPLRLGQRHGNLIIVNRQLLISNAFENLIERRYPKLHKYIRTNYDKYGYPLSRKVNTEKRSNVTYMMMKPLEYFFLLIIYLFAEKPESLINKQYSLKSQ